MHNNRLLIKSHVENELGIPSLSTYQNGIAQKHSTTSEKKKLFYFSSIPSLHHIRLVPTHPPHPNHSLPDPTHGSLTSKCALCTELVVVAFAFWPCVSFYPLNRFSFSFSTPLPRMCACRSVLCALCRARQQNLSLHFRLLLCASLRIVFIICFARCWIGCATRRLGCSVRRAIQLVRRMRCVFVVRSMRRHTSERLNDWMYKWNYFVVTGIIYLPMYFAITYYYYAVILDTIADCLCRRVLRRHAILASAPTPNVKWIFRCIERFLPRTHTLQCNCHPETEARGGQMRKLCFTR